MIPSFLRLMVLSNFICFSIFLYPGPSPGEASGLALFGPLCNLALGCDFRRVMNILSLHPIGLWPSGRRSTAACRPSNAARDHPRPWVVLGGFSPPSSPHESPLVTFTPAPDAPAPAPTLPALRSPQAYFYPPARHRRDRREFSNFTSPIRHRRDAPERPTPPARHRRDIRHRCDNPRKGVAELASPPAGETVRATRS